MNGYRENDTCLGASRTCDSKGNRPDLHSERRKITCLLQYPNATALPAHDELPSTRFQHHMGKYRLLHGFEHCYSLNAEECITEVCIHSLEVPLRSGIYTHRSLSFSTNGCNASNSGECLKQRRGGEGYQCVARSTIVVA
jgi:hypothetical protein